MPMSEYFQQRETDDYVGAGWAFPLGVNVQGGIQLSATAPNVEESIGIILHTDLGERVYRPDFGSRLSELTFEPLNTRTLLNIKLYIEEALKTWEPRIILKDVLTDPDPIRGKVDIEIIYQCKNSFDIRSFVFPFYLSKN
jgi:uncharacterized protein